MLAKANLDQEKILLVCDKMLDSLRVDDHSRIRDLEKIQALIKEYGLDNDRYPHHHRIAGLSAFIDELNEQKNNCGYLTTKYSSLENDENQNWECAQVAIKLGKWYLKTFDFTEAEKFFKIAQEKLGPQYPQEIRRQELCALQAQCWRHSGKRLDKMEALEKINAALIKDPISTSLRKELGIMYFLLCRFTEARNVLEDALFWDPNDPEIYYYLGLANFRLALSIRDLNQSSLRKKGFEKAIEYLNNALTLYGPETLADPNDIEKTHKIGQTHYWLGQAYLELNRPEPAITSLMIAGNLEDALAEQAPLMEVEQDLLEQALLEQGGLEQASLEELAPEPTSPEIITSAILPPPDVRIPADTKFYLGIAFLKNKNFNHAEELFQKLFSSSTPPPQNLEIVMWARLQYAFSLAERCGDLREAKKQIKATKNDLEMVKCYLEKVKSQLEISNNDLDEISKDIDHLERSLKKIEAFCTDCEGWIHYREGKIKQAIENLQRAVSLRADAGSYYRLAMAYESYLDKLDETSPERKKSLYKAKECLKLADDLDLRQEYKEVTQDLKDRLEKLLKKLESNNQS